MDLMSLYIFQEQEYISKMLLIFKDREENIQIVVRMIFI